MKSRHSYLEKQKPLVAIYDGFRKDMIQNALLDKNSLTFIGQFTSLPEYCLIDIGKKGNLLNEIVLLKDFNLSVVMDVFEVTEKLLDDFDEYYGYYYPNYDLNHNTRIKIKTPYGEAYLYIYNKKLKGGKIISSGDVLDYTQYTDSVNTPIHEFKQT